jgi:hypothetical protein
LFANPYYAAGLIGALIFWVWPAMLYKSMDVPLSTVGLVSAALFFGAGWAASQIHVRFIAPRRPPRGDPMLMALLCALIVGLAWLTRFAYDSFAAA